MNRVRLGRPDAFLLTLGAAYLAPLAIPNVGIDFTYFFIMCIVLFAWFILKWDAVRSLPLRGSPAEILVGVAAVLSIYGYKIHTATRLGILDMLIIFAGVVTAFYGLKAFKLFWVPASYGIVLLVGYQLESVIPNFVLLQSLMAGVMASAMRAIGVSATVSGHYVQLSSASGPLYLNVESDCTGVQGILAFGLLSTMSVLDVKAKPMRLAIVFAVGFVGAFLINIVRLFGVFLAFEFLGAGIGNDVHVYLGYSLFIVWVLIFWSIAFKYLTPRQGTTLPSVGLPVPSSNVS
jgi:exosortase/archaeosortase family protein